MACGAGAIAATLAEGAPGAGGRAWGADTPDVVSHPNRRAKRPATSAARFGEERVSPCCTQPAAVLTHTRISPSPRSMSLELRTQPLPAIGLRPQQPRSDSETAQPTPQRAPPCEPSADARFRTIDTYQMLRKGKAVRLHTKDASYSHPSREARRGSRPEE
jgi:hypothetical protein